MLSPKAAAFQVEALLKGHVGFDRCSHSKDNHEDDTSVKNLRTSRPVERLPITTDEFYNKCEINERPRGQMISEKRSRPTVLNITPITIHSPDFGSRWGVTNPPPEGRKRSLPSDEDLLQRENKKIKINQTQHLWSSRGGDFYQNQVSCFTPFQNQSTNIGYHDVVSSEQDRKESNQNTLKIGKPKFCISTNLPDKKSLHQVQKPEPKSPSWAPEETSDEKRKDPLLMRACRATKRQVVVSLQHRSLWAEFSRHQTEMIVTKNGRRMFPVIKISVQGLKPDAHYMIYLDIIPVDGKRYRYAYLTSNWVVAGAGETQQRDRLYIHPESPTTGKRWMDMLIISFDKLKLTNNKSRDPKGQIYLQSMQKYLPRIWIQKLQSSFHPNEINGHDIDVNSLHTFVDRSKAMCFTFHETNFITVTAYQNQKITRLKINTNPFAKGFRDSSKYKDVNVNRHFMTSLHCGNNNFPNSQQFPCGNLPNIRPPFLASLPFYPSFPFPSPLSHMRSSTAPNRWPAIPSVISPHNSMRSNSILNHSFPELGRNESLLNNLRIPNKTKEEEDDELK